MSEFIHVEAVNMGGVIFDTEDLSTRRAGGYMLLEMVHRIHAVGNGTLLEAISLGASIGLFKLRSGSLMDDALAAVKEVLAESLFAQATVIVVNTRDENIIETDFALIREALVAAVRKRQIQSLSVVTAFGPKPSSWAEPKHLVCQIDGLRPAIAQRPFKTSSETRSQSLSVTLRREEGRDLRQRFYARELGRTQKDAAAEWGDSFTDHFDELSRFDSQKHGWASHPAPLLEHKIAVVYADGNQFSQVAKGCKSPDELTQWDAAIQAARRAFLRQLLNQINAHPHGSTRRGDKDEVVAPRLRIETLMWGGDEFLLVLPAWLGLQAVQSFFDICQVKDNGGTACTHSVGLVMAHHNAPISTLQNLAGQLAEQGKQGKYKGHDSLNWTVLESFDHAGSDLDRYWELKGLKNLTWTDMALNPTRLTALLHHLPSLASELPRSSLHRIVQMLAAWVKLGTLDPAALRLLARAYDNVQTAVKGHYTIWAALWKAMQPKADLDWPSDLPANFPKLEHLNAWLTLLELWDYAAGCVPFEQKQLQVAP
jgi:hypothetical protein